MNLTDLLLIEDDPAVASSLRDGLTQEGYRVQWCSTGADGLRAARSQPPDLIILDVRLPDTTGFDVCRELRQAGMKQPILMLTARRDELDKVLGLEMGADDYMTKPYSLRELVARVRANLRRAYGALASGESHLLHVADLVVDLESAEIRRANTPLNLTPTEYRLFVYLVRHAGQALSRRQLLNSVWDDVHGVENERTVNVHIRRLREKIEQEPSAPTIILTVPGIGYRLVG
jgi:DNA-binding response OmpR family regulator